VGVIVVDTSVWIDFFSGRAFDILEDAISVGAIVLPPLVVAELVSGAESPHDREMIGDLLQDLPIHDTPLGHWIAVGDLRRVLGRQGVDVTTPDAHIAQCAIECDAPLLTRDAVFTRIAKHTALRVQR